MVLVLVFHYIVLAVHYNTLYIILAYTNYTKLYTTEQQKIRTNPLTTIHSNTVDMFLWHCVTAGIRGLPTDSAKELYKSK